MTERKPGMALTSTPKTSNAFIKSAGDNKDGSVLLLLSVGIEIAKINETYKKINNESFVATMT